VTFLWPLLVISVGLIPLGVVVARQIDVRRRERLASLGSPSAASAATGRPGGAVAGRIASALVVAAFVLFAVRPRSRSRASRARWSSRSTCRAAWPPTT